MCPLFVGEVKDVLNFLTFRGYFIDPLEAHVRNKKVENRRTLLKLLREINRVMLESVPSKYLYSSTPARHNVSGKSTVISFQSKALQKLFERIYEAYFTKNF